MICVARESRIMDRLKEELSAMAEGYSCNLLHSGEEAIRWIENHTVQIAVLDVELLGINAVGLALRLKECNPKMQIIFARLLEQNHIEYWTLEPDNYTLKQTSEIKSVLEKNDFLQMKDKDKKIVIETIPRFSVSIDGVPFHLSREKVRELFALLVDCGGRGITTKEAIAYLWPERPNDVNTQALFRVTYKRLLDVLRSAGIDYIIASERNHRFLRGNFVDCDLYRIISGDEQAARKYDGKYLQEYSWAEERNGQLHRMLISNK